MIDLIKRLVLVASVCLTALLISSCGGGGTESGTTTTTDTTTSTATTATTTTTTNSLFSLDVNKGVTCNHPEEATRDNDGTSRRQQCKWYCGNYQGTQRFVSITWKASDSTGYKWSRYSDNIWNSPYASSYCPSGQKGGIVGAQGGGGQLFTVDVNKGVTCYDADEEELDNTGHARTRMCKWKCGLYQGTKRFVLIRWKATDSNGFQWTRYSDNIWSTCY